MRYNIPDRLWLNKAFEEVKHRPSNRVDLNSVESKAVDKGFSLVCLAKSFMWSATAIDVGDPGFAMVAAPLLMCGFTTAYFARDNPRVSNFLTVLDYWKIVRYSP